MMKKWLSLCLCALLLLSLTACGKTPPVKTDDPPAPVDENYQQGMAKLESGNLAEAYTLLKAATDPRAAKELEKFIFVPTTVHRKNSIDSADYTTTFTYDKAGNLLEEKSTGQFDWYTERDICSTYTYDEGNRVLTYVYQYGGTTTKHTYTYDKDGNKLSDCYYNTSGALSYRVDCTYDERGNLLTEKHEDNLDAAENYTYTFTYDDQDRLLTRITTYYDGENTVYRYTYDKKGNYRYSYVYYEENARGEMVPITYTAYFDSEGNSLGYEHVEADGTIREQEEIRRNENGDAVYRRILYAWGDSWDGETVTTRTYNERGQLLTIESVKEGEITSSTEYTYDENGNKLTYDYYGGSSSWGREVYTYDEQGHLLTLMDMADWGWAKYTYTYDEAGNCIKEEENDSASDSTADFTHDEWGNVTGYNYYRTASGVETATVATAQWELRYYPDGMPIRVESAIQSAKNLLG